MEFLLFRILPEALCPILNHKSALNCKYLAGVSLQGSFRHCEKRRVSRDCKLNCVSYDEIVRVERSVVGRFGSSGDSDTLIGDLENY